ncbi:hypothetical protein Gferi_06000 [Geosporobacter ferrireducens]|uniref:Uncharacterized protein n=1 Tax=Geosporobacter ferrireducens TaxID=1424294 RepID=A0A1D8GE35_9FIRM|nr:hypothetical protein Gferi_06000 [Geosporobacter ferrireducens]
MAQNLLYYTKAASPIYLFIVSLITIITQINIGRIIFLTSGYGLLGKMIISGLVIFPMEFFI